MDLGTLFSSAHAHCMFARMKKLLKWLSFLTCLFRAHIQHVLHILHAFAFLSYEQEGRVGLLIE